MSRYYMRKTPGARENLEAGALAAGLALGIGAVTFYFLRILRSREPIPELPARSSADKALPSPGEDTETE